MNRRGFFSALAAVAATAVLDPERLLWISGARLISIPKPRMGPWDFEVSEGWGFFKTNELWEVDKAGNTTRLFVDNQGDGKFRLADDSYWIGRPAPFVVIEASVEPISN